MGLGENVLPSQRSTPPGASKEGLALEPYGNRQETGPGPQPYHLCGGARKVSGKSACCPA
ncbi:hypothetical protein I79_005130 [Cricetulus griseus]|uniref:Uncharacterized protein n=1 Tax=Cricetulus griseus TaxID=10029 RepID=G3H4D0_CRIGR|nr:hypothetical protein I79_005130 [Cricetulus griseus]